MNPNFVFPIPTKNSQNSPFDRIQDNKNTFQALLKSLKGKPINQNPVPLNPQPDTSKRVIQNSSPHPKKEEEETKESLEPQNKETSKTHYKELILGFIQVISLIFFSQ